MIPCFLVFCIEVGPQPHFLTRPRLLVIQVTVTRSWECFVASRDLGTRCIHTGLCKLFQILKEPLFLLNSHVLSKGVFFFFKRVEVLFATIYKVGFTGSAPLLFLKI